MRRSSAISPIAAAGLALAAALPSHADAPRRVVSMNLCTDQLAMMLADEGQLVSVSAIARDPLSSVMHEEAAAYPENHGGAEEIYLLRPDLVLAGIWSDPATVSMLRGLGIEVAQLDVADTLEDIPDRVAEMGALLGREDAAQTLIRRFETDLAALAGAPGGPRAAFYYPNGYTLGTGSLGHEILTHAGFTHIVDELGRDASGRVALELLVVAAPDLVIGATQYPGASRSEEILRHPALRTLVSAAHGTTSGPEWVCGTPHVLRALAGLAGTRAAMEAN
ncbi:ABC transporter substrate-binding protein [Roseibacterium sp. SDUM158017]|uniref:ABC transporter substrate-binding protein n=1 Tax=Roseicyclus salinarum TaxID=3036773 RepID=UPI002414EE3D|nr:ABC transporter substrate-binding protein [Roseibacterium sp. SDUM158017]MDG4647007.1 ABC transporter substrate-binding protein [Roseibacterium sp. SDUM158017]